MAQIGEKRPAEHEVEEESVEEGSREGSPCCPNAPSSPLSSPPAAKRPAVPINFVFRPSPLQQATQGFVLRQSTLKSPSSSFGSSKSSSTTKSTTPLQGGFLKLSSDGLKPINVASSSPPLVGVAVGGATTPTISQHNSSSAITNNDTAKRDNPFLQFVASTSTNSHTFSSLSSTGTPNSVFSAATRSVNQLPLPSAEEDRSTVDTVATAAAVAPQSAESSGNSSFGEESTSTAPVPIGHQKATAILPEVLPVTGEEGEKKIVQVPARLYAFDLDTHTWKERGRGEIRLNDAAQSEGLFQSRLVMRASGSYRLLLNTHLWAQMKCDRANQKSIRITAQTGSDGNISVFLIMGAGKDIQQLFTAIDRRIEALKRNATTDQESKEGAKSVSTKSSQNASFDEEDKESLLEYRSSPESSPEPPGSSTRTRLIPVPILTTSPSPATKATPTVTMVTTPPTAGGMSSSSSGVGNSSNITVTTTPQIPMTSSETNDGAGERRHGSRKDLLRRSSSSTSDKESESSGTPNPPSSERSSSCEASTPNVSSSDNALESS